MQEDGAAAAAAMLRAGLVWKGGGLKTGVVGKVLFRPTSVPLATGSLCYWGSLALAWKVPGVPPTGSGTEAAFALAEIYKEESAWQEKFRNWKKADKVRKPKRHSGSFA